MKGGFMSNRPEDLHLALFAAERGRGDDETRCAGDEDVRGVANDEDDDDFEDDDLDEEDEENEDI
jgi:hypothetical protein